MTDEALDALAKQLLLDAARLEYSDIIQSDEQHTFSPSFERKMKKLVRRADHPVRHRVAQTAACVALVVIIGGGSVLAVSAEARAAFFGWVREVYEDVFAYHYEGAETIVPEDVIYIPSWVPDGYEMTLVPKPGGMVTTAYQNDTGNLIVVICNFDTESTTTHVATDGVEALPASVNGIPADFYYDAEEGASSILVWHDEEIGAMFQISAPLPQEDIIKIAESVTAFDAAELTMADAVFRPTWLPEGYAESMVPELDGQVAVIYKNEDGNLMSFSYSTDPEIINLQVEGNKGSIERVFIGDLPGDLYIDADEDAHDVLVWMDDQNGIIYWISANLPAEDLIKMAESVELTQ